MPAGALMGGLAGMLLLVVAHGAFAADGKTVYEGTCIACHGADGKGTLPGVPDLTDKSGRLSKPDNVLLKNMTEGFQSPGSPLAMPAKGGNPALGADDLKAVLTYMRQAFGR